MSEGPGSTSYININEYPFASVSGNGQKLELQYGALASTTVALPTEMANQSIAEIFAACAAAALSE